MNIASVVASRSTCPRKFVGSVIVREKTILSTGYNGSIRGMPHCSEVGHMMEDGHCVRTVHAEANAIIQAAKNGDKVTMTATVPARVAHGTRDFFTLLATLDDGTPHLWRGTVQVQ